MKGNKHIQSFNEHQENLNISDVISSFSDRDEQNFEFAKWIFKQEEGREADMNNNKDMNAVAMLEVGVRYTRNYL
mgnify:CR=1 FL=1